jgi:hypothetical protein
MGLLLWISLPLPITGKLYLFLLHSHAISIFCHSSLFLHLSVLFPISVPILLPPVQNLVSPNLCPFTRQWVLLIFPFATWGPNPLFTVSPNALHSPNSYLHYRIPLPASPSYISVHREGSYETHKCTQAKCQGTEGRGHFWTCTYRNIQRYFVERTPRLPKSLTLVKN